MSFLSYNYEHPTPSSHLEVLRRRDTDYSTLLESGLVTPFRYPFDTFALGLLGLSVLFLPTISTRVGRVLYYVSSSLILCFSIYTTTTVRCQCLANGYGTGLATLWGVLWAGVLLVFNDPKTAFQRIERRSIEAAKNAFDTNHNSNDHRKHRDAVLDSQRKNLLDWQPYPERFFHRLDWTVDLVTSFRGPGWNWRLPALPKLAKDDDGKPRSAPYLLQPTIRAYTVRFLVFYIWIDALKVFMIHDPYFWGVAALDSPAPDHYPSILTHSKALTKSYRLLISTIGVGSALEIIFTLNPLFFGGLLANYFPSISYAPYDEPFLYPPQWGNAIDILERGLAGFWGKWWHQMFRLGISEPSRYLISKLKLDPRSTTARILQVTIAFALSGSLHAAGSYTQFADTRPLRPFLFFMAQGLGILGQTSVTRYLGTKNLPRWLRRTGNGMFIVVWAYYTGPLLADDFARGGIWLFEPLPFSLLRGLGWGLPEEGFTCWHGKWFRVWSRGRWWERGFAII